MMINDQEKMHTDNSCSHFIAKCHSFNVIIRYYDTVCMNGMGELNHKILCAVLNRKESIPVYRRTDYERTTETTNQERSDS